MFRISVKFTKLRNQQKKYKATFYDHFDKKIKTVKFGNSNYEDYTTHKDKARKLRYIQRHKSNEDWNKYDTPGALSRYILWEKTDVTKAIKSYTKRFNLHLIK